MEIDHYIGYAPLIPTSALAAWAATTAPVPFANRQLIAAMRWR